MARLDPQLLNRKPPPPEPEPAQASSQRGEASEGRSGAPARRGAAAKRGAKRERSEATTSGVREQQQQQQRWQGTPPHKQPKLSPLPASASDHESGQLPDRCLLPLKNAVSYAGFMASCLCVKL